MVSVIRPMITGILLSECTLLQCGKHENLECFPSMSTNVFCNRIVEGFGDSCSNVLELFNWAPSTNNHASFAKLIQLLCEINI